MSASYLILLLEDEPLILMDLEFAAHDQGHEVICATNTRDALKALGNDAIKVAVLDVSLKRGDNCQDVASELDRLGIPYLLHSGDLDRQDETVSQLGAMLMPKPSSAAQVIAAAAELAAKHAAPSRVTWRQIDYAGAVPRPA